MKRGLAPKGYISIHDAVAVMADLQDYAPEDAQWLDFGDRLADAEAIAAAVGELRQRLCDGELTAHYQPEQGKKAPVPEWIWSGDEASLQRAGSFDPFDKVYLFHTDGIEIDGIRHRVFLVEAEFEALQRRDTKPNPSLAAKIKRKQGRPKGVGAFDDDRWLDEMERLVRSGWRPYSAAVEVVARYGKDIQRKDGIGDPSVIARLYKKYVKSGRLESSPATG